MRCWIAAVTAVLGVTASLALAAPSVNVSLSVGDPILSVGQRTSVSVLAEVLDPASSTDGLFSFDLNVTFSAPGILAIDGGTIIQPDAEILLSPGTVGPTGLSASYGTYFYHLNFGIGGPKELVRFSADALAPGSLNLTVSADTMIGDDFMLHQSAPPAVTYPAARSVSVAPRADRTWGVNAGGSFSTDSNWVTGVAPNATGDVAIFGTAIDHNCTVAVDTPTTLGTLSFDANNNYLLAGPATLTLQNSGSAASSVTVVHSGPGSGHDVSANVMLASPLTINVASDAAITFSGAIGGTGGGLTKTGAGTLTLSGANTYTGVTAVAAGVLRLDSANALPGGIGTTGGTSALTFNGGVVGLGNGDFTRSLGAPGTVTAANFTGNGGWAAYGADRAVNLGGGGTPATITWATANTGFNGGTLILGASTATHMVDLQNPLDLGTATRTVQVDDGAAAIDGKLSGVLSGGTGGGLTKTGSGTLWLSNTNTYTAATTISAGTLSVGANANLGNANLLVFNGGTLQVTGTALTNFGSHTPIFSATKTVGLDINNAANTFTVSQVLNQTTGGLTKSGAGTLILSCANTYSGGTLVQEGTLLVSNTADSGTGSGAVTVATATLGGTGFINGPVVLTGDSTLTSTATLTINNTLTVKGLANQLSVGTVLTTGDVTIDPGAVFIINGTLGGGTGDLIVRGTLMGKGTINKSCVIEAGGVLSPGAPSTIQGMAQILNALAPRTFSFEIGAASPNYANPTNSVNDVVRLTDPSTPFADATGGAAALTADTVIDVYFLDDDPALGGYKAEFFAATDFTDAVADATYQYWRLDPRGSRYHNGNSYSPLDSSLVDWSVVPEMATFDGAPASGYITQFSVAPEPATLALLAFGGLALLSRRRK